jgi:hypothetical protein
MGTEVSSGGSIPVLRQVGKGHSVVGKHRVDCIRERFDDFAEEVGAVHFADVIAELDIGKLGDPIDCQEHFELALGLAKLADMDVSDRRCGELAPFGGLIWALGPPGNVMAIQAAMQAGSQEDYPSRLRPALYAGQFVMVASRRNTMAARCIVV